jgi:SAM-dependent methyltransferase/glycosyltransferase involved in cell wall biosynthesis
MLKFTGERYLPEVDGQIELEHLHRYLLAARLVRGKAVLDIASGEGYGSDLLAKHAATVVGVDVSPETVEHARSRYSASPNLRFLVGDCSDIPLGDSVFDVVVSFETIEHHDKHEEMLKEVRRVLKPNGLLLISSPDRYNYSRATGYKNEFHVKELYRHEFEGLLSRHFKHVTMLGQRVAYGSFILPESKGGFVSHRRSQATVDESVGVVDPVYLIALTSDGRLPSPEGGLLDSPIEKSDLVIELQRRIAEREGQVSGLSHAVEARDVEIAELRGKVDGLSHAIEIRNAELEKERLASASRDAALSELRSVVEHLQERVGEGDNALKLRDAAYSDRVRELEEARHQAEVASRSLDELTRRYEQLRDEKVTAEITLLESQGRLQSLAAEAEARRSELTQVRNSSVQQVVEINARDVALNEARTCLAATAQALESSRHELAAERNRAAGLSAELAELNRRLLDAEESKQQQLILLQQAEAEHAREASALLAKIAEFKTEIGELQRSNSTHSESVAQAREYAQQLLTQNQAFALQLAGRAAEIDATHAQLAEMDADRQLLKEALAADRLRSVSYQQRVLELEGIVGDHRKIIQQIWSSRSWRMTKGFRFAGRLARGDWRGTVGAMRRFLGLVGAKPDASGMPTLPALAPLPPLATVAAASQASRESTLDATAAVESAQPIALPTAPGHRILLVSYYCPSRSHAGGLRILDLYALIRRKAPGTELHLYTHRRPSIDWSEDEVSSIFDRVYWSPTEELSAAGLTALAGEPQRFNVIDLQFHQAALDINAFRLMSQTILFTPMESLARFSFLQARSAFQATGRFPLRELARGFRAVAEEVVFSFRVDKVICVSRSDAAFLRAVTCLRSVQSLETGVSEIEFPGAGAGGQMRDLAATGRTVLYVAYFGSQTNVHALRWFLDHVHPSIVARVPGYRFIVVGRGDLSAFAGYAGPTVEFVGEVPRIAPYIESARVGIAPALSGSGFRGKVNQYALFSVPTVVSPLSAKGLAYQSGKDILIGRSAAEFADHCIALLLDEQLNLSIGAAARATCADKYTWESKWPAVARLYEIPVLTP